MNISEEQLEQRLRALFADERLDLPPPPGAGTVIVARAKRRRRRRQGVLAASGVAVALVAVSGGIALMNLHPEDGTAAMSDGGSSKSGPLLDADGFGTLKLGMSEAQIAAQGVTLSDARAGASCITYTAHGSGLPSTAVVVVSKAVGLAVVTPQHVAHTAEGIGAGSTKDQVLATYPAAKAEPGGLAAPVRGTAVYHFRLDGSGVVQTSLASVHQDCAG